MAAIMKLRSIFVFTHDSIGLGEDGPTHQSVEHAASLRLIPHMDVWRPATPSRPPSRGLRQSKRADGPSCLLFTRQNVAVPVARCRADRVDPPRRAMCSPTGMAQARSVR
jgi:transketolase